MRTATVLVLSAVIAASAPALASEEPRLEMLFTHRAEIRFQGTAEGLLWVELPAEVVAECRPDLSDLRLIGTDGRPIGFGTDLGPPPGYREQVIYSRELKIVEAERAEGEDDWRKESYVVEIPPSIASSGRSHDLVIETRERPYTRRIRIEDDRGKTLTEGTVFRLTEAGARRSRLTLPRTTGGALRIRLWGQDTRYLEPRFRLEATWPLRRIEPDRIELEILSREHAEGRTSIEVRRPPGVVPRTLEIASSDRAYGRRVDVYDLQTGRELGKLGEGKIYRFPAVADRPEIDRRTLAVSRPRGDRLRIVVHDRDSAPLESLRVTALQPRSRLAFPFDGRTERESVIATVYYGGGRVDPPRFDVAGLIARLPADLSIEAFPRATLSGVEPNPLLVAEPFLSDPERLGWAHRAGAAIDPARFRHARSLTVTPSDEGLGRVRLTAQDVAAASDDLGDLRIVDGDARQWPYVIDRSVGVERVEATAELLETEDGESRYRLELPFEGTPLAALELDPDAPFLDREYRLVRREERIGEPDRETTLARGRLQRRIGDGPLKIALGNVRALDLELVVRDGDDAPLVFDRITAHVPVADLLLPAPDGEYTLLLGSDDVAPPRYELARIRDVVLAVSATEAEVGPLTVNEAHRPWFGEGRTTVLLWGAILLAVAVLGGLVLRLGRGGNGFEQGSGERKADS